MSTDIKAFGTSKEGLTVELLTVQLPALKANEVLVKNQYCSICSSDIHSILGEWGSFEQLGVKRIIPSHEIYGQVIEVGSDVTHLKVGDSVGIGWQSASCHTCRECDEQSENLCSKKGDTIYHATGGFGEKTIVDAQFAFKVPDVIDPSHVCPFMCAGITVFSPIYRWIQTVKVTRPAEAIEKYGLKAVVYGLGGLGHLAVQFLNNYGVEVTAISRSDKHDFAKQLGAKAYVNSNNAEEMKALEGQFDFVLNTANTADADLSPLLGLLRPHGTFKYAVLGAPEYKFPSGPALFKELSIHGTVIGGPHMMNEMFDFVAKTHGPDGKQPIVPLIEVRDIAFDQDNVAKVNDALTYVHDNKARFRVVFKY